jgi:Tfp pilus assembly protein PilF
LFPAIKAVKVSKKALQQRFAQYQQGNILVELGYNNLLQKKDAKANTYFDQALERIKKNPKKCTE